MHAAAFNREIYAAFSEVAHEYSLPHIVVSYRPQGPCSRPGWQDIAATSPAVVQIMPGADPAQWDELYCELLASMDSD